LNISIMVRKTVAVDKIAEPCDMGYQLYDVKSRNIKLCWGWLFTSSEVLDQDS